MPDQGHPTAIRVFPLVGFGSMGERFLKVPAEVLSTPNLNPTDKLVAAYVLDREALFVARGDVFRQGASRVADFLGVSEHTVRRSLSRLESLGLVTVDRKTGSPAIVAMNPGQTGRGSESDPGQTGRGTPAKLDGVPRPKWTGYPVQSGRQERLSRETEERDAAARLGGGNGFSPDQKAATRAQHVRPDHEARAQRIVDTWGEAYAWINEHNPELPPLVRPAADFYEATKLAKDLGDVVDLFSGDLLRKELVRLVLCWDEKGLIPKFAAIAGKLGQPFPGTDNPDPVIWQGKKRATSRREDRMYPNIAGLRERMIAEMEADGRRPGGPSNVVTKPEEG